MNVQAVVFDFDGVLADTALDIAASVRATQRQYGLPEMTTAEIMSFVGWGAKHLIDHTVPVEDEQKQAEILAWYKNYYGAHPCDETVLYPGIQEMLASFKARGVKMSVVSNKPEPLTKMIVDKLGIAAYFTRVIGPESVTRMKPDPEGLLLCANAMGVDPEHCMMVGDSYTDIEAGKAAAFGCTCAVLYGYGNKEKLNAAGADFAVRCGMEISEKTLTVEEL
ncbi:MAG: HAD-IA family hydrolase [Clostridia bacterium]|nr:HAD-IA family hydrolase [Clostridia bacterium]